MSIVSNIERVKVALFLGLPVFERSINGAWCTITNEAEIVDDADYRVYWSDQQDVFVEYKAEPKQAELFDHSATQNASTDWEAVAEHRAVVISALQGSNDRLRNEKQVLQDRVQQLEKQVENQRFSLMKLYETRDKREDVSDHLLRSRAQCEAYRKTIDKLNLVIYKARKELGVE